MIKTKGKLFLAVCMLVLMVAVAGCGGGGGAQRLTGLSADATVKTFFDNAKAGKLSDAALYVSPSSTNDPRTVVKYLTGQSGLEELKNANLLSLKKVAEQGDYAVVMATLQPEQNNMKLIVKPVGLEKVNGEWYIVDFDKIYQDAKYNLLLQLMNKI